MLPIHGCKDEVERVIEVARELTRQWEKDDGGLPLGWLLSALADALDALDVEEQFVALADDNGRAWRRRCARLGVAYEEE